MELKITIEDALKRKALLPNGDGPKKHATRLLAVRDVLTARQNELETGKETPAVILERSQIRTQLALAARLVSGFRQTYGMAVEIAAQQQSDQEIAVCKQQFARDQRDAKKARRTEINRADTPDFTKRRGHGRTTQPLRGVRL